MSDTDNLAAPEAPELPVAALATARQAQNLSVADAARQLKLSVSQIEALEAGDFGKLPGTIFVRGFIRNYARLLKLDADALLLSVDRTLPTQPAREEVPPSREIPFPTEQPRRGPWYALALVLLLGGLAAFEFFWNEPESAVSKPVTPPVTAVQKIELPAPVETPAGSDPAKATEVPLTAPATPSSGVPPSANEQNKAVADVPAAGQAAASESSRQPLPGERPLRLVFKTESWAEVRDRSGKIVFSQINPAGSQQQFYGMPPLSVVIGNAHGVQLTYNGQPVDLARHTKVDVARFTLE